MNMNQILNSVKNKIIFSYVGCFAIVVPTIIMLPVLLWPHYGLFSDAGQAIEFPKLFIKDFPHTLDLLRPLEDGRWNPLFHALTIFIYSIVPDSSRALFFAQWLMFAGSSYILAWVVTKLTNSKWLAILGVVIYSTSSSIFENFFTLDKVEPRITFFSSLIIALIISKLLSFNNNEKPKNSWLFYVTTFFLSIWVLYSKETGTYLIAALGGTWIACLINPKWGLDVRALFRNVLVVNILVLITFIVLFKLLSANMSYRYVTYEITPLLLISNASYYLRTSPELGLSLFSAIYWCLRIFWKRLPGPVGSIQAIIVFVSIATLSYFAGICLWRWPLDYYLLPAHYMGALLLPLTVWSLATQKVCKLVLVKLFVWILGFLWIGYFGLRIILGYAIYAQDAVKDDVANYLSQPEWFERRIVLPLSHPDNAEIGERLEFFINHARTDENPVNIFNFWETPVNARQNFERFKGSAGISPDISLLQDVARYPERFIIWQFGTSEHAYIELVKRHYEEKPEKEDNWFIGMIWRPSYLNREDVLVVPTGSPLLASIVNWSNVRGLSLYTGNQETFMHKLPLILKPLAHIHRGPAIASLGWDIFSVEGNTEDTNVSLGYSLSSLITLNNESDITPHTSSKILFEEKSLPTNGLFLGNGWYGLEQNTDINFRWMGSKSEIVLTHLPVGYCTINMDIEPLIMSDNEPLSLVFSTGDNRSEFLLKGRNVTSYKFKSTGKTFQVINISLNGGATHPPKGDTRLLKARVFQFNLLSCSAE